jgi:hypothetical protein
MKAFQVGAVAVLLLSAPAISLGHDLPDSDLSEAPAEDYEALRMALEADQGVPARREARRNMASSTSGDSNPEIALILDISGAWFSVDKPLQTGGHDPVRTGFNLQSLEMAIQGNVDPYFRYFGTFVFSQFGVEIEEAWVQTLALPWNLQVRAGQMLTRFGRINSTHPHSWSFLDQPMIIGKFLGSEGSRGLGAEVSWLLPIPWYLEILGSMTDAAGECCARSFLGGNDLAIRGIGDFLYTVAAKTFIPFDDAWSLMWGVSGQFGPNASGQGNRTEIYATDLYLRWKPVGDPGHSSVSLQVEAMYRARQVPGDSLRDWGGYAQLVGRFEKRWEVGARAEYASGLPGDPLDPEWDSHRHRYSVQGTFYPSHFSRIRLQGGCDLPSWKGRPVWSAILGLEVAIGAHGAHSF